MQHGSPFCVPADNECRDIETDALVGFSFGTGTVVASGVSMRQKGTPRNVARGISSGAELSVVVYTSY